MKLTKIHLIFFFLFTIPKLFGQLNEDFSDGDFTNSPTWSGTTADFQINSAKQLQLNAQTASTSYLTVPLGLTSINDKEWRIWIRQSFSGSSSNFGRVFLTADNLDLSNVQNGYYLQFGEANATDAIRLYKLENGVSTQICSGINGQIANSFNISLKITHKTNGDWIILGDFAGGTNYSSISIGNDLSNLVGGYFGIQCTYTSSNSTKFYYDNIYIGDEILDLTPPILLTTNVISKNKIDVLFDEPVSVNSSQNSANYLLSPTISISNATRDLINENLIHLTLGGNLLNGTFYTLTTTNIQDTSGNTSNNQTLDFQYLIADTVKKGDVIISEFFPDPSPVIGLPEVEYIEVFNNSSKIFNLSGWKIGDAASDGTISSEWLMPGDYKVLTATSNNPLFTMTNALGVTSFPSLNNSGDDIVLKDSIGNIIDKITYTTDWYGDPNKVDGGFSIELINPNDPCSDQNNWRASTSTIGGTPGFKNSVYDNSPDSIAPQITLLLALPLNFLEIHFSEGMDSTALANANFSFSPNLSIKNRFIQGTFPTKMTLEFFETLETSKMYELIVSNIGDCWLNYADLKGSFALPDNPKKSEVIVNEILQNPLNGGQDWIELYNNSEKIFNLKNWQLANFDNDTIANFKTFQNDYFLFPHDFVVIGKDSNFVKSNYPVSVTGKFSIEELPSYNNDSGTVYLIYNSEIIDKVSYLDTWHFDLLDNTDGVSLERIDPNGESSSAFNWHSAAEDIGFATPGRINSQYLLSKSNGVITLTSDVFSPDNDGYEDVLQVSYDLPEAGLLGKVTIFDDRGRKIKELFNNELLGAYGTFSWDGLTTSQVKASIGVYVLLFEAFSTDGGVIFTTKKAVTLAGKV